MYLFLHHNTTKAKLIATLLLIFSACGQRYGYLSKIAAQTKRGIVAVEVVNWNKEILDYTFETSVKEHIAKRLRHEGYKCSQKNAQYDLVLEMKIDSSINTGFTYGGPGVGTYLYSRKSKAILFDLVLKSRKNGLIVWRSDYDLYFFGDAKRDLKRTKGVIKFLVGGIKQ